MQVYIFLTDKNMISNFPDGEKTFCILILSFVLWILLFSNKYYLIQLSDGFILDKTSSPLGVLLVIFESRPEALVQVYTWPTLLLLILIKVSWWIRTIDSLILL